LSITQTLKSTALLGLHGFLDFWCVARSMKRSDPRNARKPVGLPERYIRRYYRWRLVLVELEDGRMRFVLVTLGLLVMPLACGERTAFDSPSPGRTLSPAGSGGSDGNTSFCASQPSTGLLVCDDFSAEATTPSRRFLPWNDMPSLLMSLSGGALIFEKPTAFAASYAVLGAEAAFLDTSIEATMSAETRERSLSAVCWGNPSNLISVGLQRDEGALYLHVVVGGNVQTRLSASAQTEPHRSQRVRMEVGADGSIRGFVDGKLILSATADLSRLPRMLTPGINANSYPPMQRFTFDDFVVRNLAQP
jgi:hypothetical protein